MIDLRQMAMEDFSVPVMPEKSSAVRFSLTVDEQGMIRLNSKLAVEFFKRPVRVNFLPDGTAIQIAVVGEAEDGYVTSFPKNGRRKFPRSVTLLRKKKLTFPVRYESTYGVENGVWRGGLVPNPTTRSSGGTRSTRKK